jgi:predicted DNA-binding protein
MDGARKPLHCISLCIWLCTRHTGSMSQIVVRSDEETDRALQHLVELTGKTRSVAVREAIKVAERETLLALASRQAAALREDPRDLAEMAAVAEDMESLRAW